MPSKSRHRKAKHLPQSKKKKGGQHFPANVARQPEVAQTHEPVSQSSVPTPSPSVPTPVARVAAVQYPHIAAELRAIGILAGIMVVILVILALVLP